MAPKTTIRNLDYLRNVRVTPGKGELQGWKLGEAFDDVGNSVGNVANQLASNPGGSNVTPPKIGGVQAQHLGNGLVDIQITDNGKVQRAVDYVVEIADNPGYSNSRVVHFSPSRNLTTTLPNGKWYGKVYSQYRFGGPPSEALTFGPVAVSGSANGTLFPSQGCGTAGAGTTGQGAGLLISR